MNFEASTKTIEKMQQRACASAYVAKRVEEVIKTVCDDLGRQAAKVTFAEKGERLTPFQVYLLATSIAGPVIREALQSLPLETLLDAFKGGCMKQIQELDRGQTNGDAK